MTIKIPILDLKNWLVLKHTFHLVRKIALTFHLALYLF